MTNVIFHHGIRGQRWGVRRFQNKDGGLTPLGRRRYADGVFKADPEKKSGASGSNTGGSTTTKSPYRYNPKERHVKNVASAKSNIKKMYNSSVPAKTEKTEYAKDKVNSLVGKIGSKSASDADSWTPPKDFKPPTFKQWVQSKKNADSKNQKTESTKKQDPNTNDKNGAKKNKQETNEQKKQQQQKSNEQKNQEKINVDGLAKDANTLKRIADAYNPREKKKMDLSKLSNKEMQDALQRKNLEKQYLKEFGEDTDTTKAMNQITKVLGIAGDTLTVAAAIESITSQFSNKRK